MTAVPQMRCGSTSGVLLAGALLFLCAVCAGAAGTGTSAAPAPGSAAGLRVGWTEAECRAPAPDADRDADGVDDRCEQALAAAFAPLLVFDAGECGWDASVVPARVGGGYLYVVQRALQPGRVRIAYLPAYHRDCGWGHAACLLTPWLCGGHAGDSELVAVDAEYSPRTGRWESAAVFLSAHCHGRSDGRCRWYAGGALEGFRWADRVPRGAPVVWVASGKHGGYPTPAACEGGHWGYDSCRPNRAAVRFPVLSLRQNAGSRARPFPYGAGEECVGPEEPGWRSPEADPTARECFWSEEADFRGWQAGEGRGATGYGRYLRELGL